MPVAGKDLSDYMYSMLSKPGVVENIIEDD
jgi:hypothetical protein